MEVSITKFRREIFELVNQAIGGHEVSVLYKGRRVKIVPEEPTGSKLNRITPLQVISPGVATLDDPELKEEMERALEQDWKTL
jgi:antitoxin (DNA-binding transcriptional repressor) of toxin-antitoxin stability system